MSTAYLFVISAPSGAGKTTLCQKLLADFPNLKLSISCTTRPPRGQEQNGREYYFLTRAEFESRINLGEFAEFAEVHGNLYGTSKAFLAQALSDGKHVLLDIDVQGADSLKASFGKRCITIFISPPDLLALEQRLKARGTDSAKVIEARLNNARTEMKAASRFDYQILNDDLDRAYSDLRLIVEQNIKGQAR